MCPWRHEELIEQNTGGPQAFPAYGRCRRTRRSLLPAVIARVRGDPLASCRPPVGKGGCARAVEECAEPVPQGQPHLPVLGLANAIDPFPGIFLEVEQFVRPAVGALDVLEVLGADGTRVSVFEEHFVRPFEAVTPHESGVAPADSLRVGFRLDAQVVQQSRKEVVRGHHCGSLGAGWNHSRMVPDEWHPNRLLVHVERNGPVALAPDSMVTTVESLVRGKDDERVFADTEFVELLEHAPDVRVHSRDQSRVAAIRLFVPEVPAEPAAPLRMWIGAREAGEVRPLVGPPVLLGLVVVRAVGCEERDHQAERPFMMPVEEVDRTVADEVRLVAGVPHRTTVDEELGVAVGASSSPRRVPVVETRLGLVILAQMPLSDEAAGVAVRLEHVRERHLPVEERPALRAVAVLGEEKVLHPVMRGQLARVVGRSRRRADRGAGVCPAKPHPPCRQPVEMGRVHLLATAGSKGPCAVVVRHEEHDVRCTSLQGGGWNEGQEVSPGHGTVTRIQKPANLDPATTDTSRKTMFLPSSPQGIESASP